MALGRPRSCLCGQCAKCHRADYMREWYRKASEERGRPATGNRDPEAVRRADAKRSGTPRRRRSNRMSNDRQRERWPEKFRARAVVAYALKKGAIKKNCCEACGSLTTEAHHDDYSLPLEVRWLCRPHHKAVHGHLRDDYQPLR